MAKSQENGTTILLGLKGYEVGRVTQEQAGVVIEVRTDLKKPACPRCGSANLYRHGRAKKRQMESRQKGLHRDYPTALAISRM